MRGIAEEIVVALDVPRNRVPLTTKFRSTWIVASQNALRDCGFFDRYTKLLSQVHRDILLTAVVGTWLPVSVAVAHYSACDELGLSEGDIKTIGTILTRHLNNAFVSVAGRFARQVGATPWLPLSYARRVWDRMCTGGAIAVYKEGPKEARVEVLGCTLGHIPYFREGLRDLGSGLGALFCEAMYVKLLPTAKEPTTIVYRASWA
ncbi:hypothetical protein LVJ94_52955 [Pendulispora rubella]|uniref:Uncharacterized protein n=1 Tax=Pendulispora rubella TaxID=2741070 RepID=A0ABZ2L7R3_9BACT